MNKYLNISNTILSKDNINRYLEKLSAQSVVTKYSLKATYPKDRIKDNFEYISLIYTLLVKHAKLKIPIHPAGEWLLDNFYIIEKNVKSVLQTLKLKKYCELPSLAEISSREGKTYYESIGFPRVYFFVNDIVSFTDANFDQKDLEDFIMSYQKNKNFTMNELCNLDVFLKICIIEKIRKLCEKIFLIQTKRFKEKDRSQKMNEKENIDIAIDTLSMKNAITSLNKLSRIDFSKIFQNTNSIEKILLKDPAKIYSKMDTSTKVYYRDEIKKFAKISNKSEEDIAKKVIELCESAKGKKSHVGFYLITEEGRKILYESLTNKKYRRLSYKQKSKVYIFSIYTLSMIIVTLLFLIPHIRLLSLLFFIPIQNATTKIIQYILSKIVKPKALPKIDLHEKLPEEYSTMCIIPVVLDSEEKVEKIVKNMEIYYLANKTENLYFTLLGDCTTSKNEKEKVDEKISSKGIELTKKLNKIYGEKFFFCYRKREWSNSEKCYMGYERKRGMINEFNEFLETENSKFRVNTIEKIPKIKYVITIDEDTNLTLNSVFDLVGTMCHILNTPEVDKIKNIVTNGHAIIQPQISIDIESANKTMFSKIFSIDKGFDIYTNIFSNVYQDNFDEAIYEGKGIYDLDAFYKVMKDNIPDNTVLSHDLLEGSFLRCGFASDIILLDNFPSNYTSYKKRFERWMRGDIQLIPFLKSRINALSKYKILDNISRNLNEFFIFASILLGIILQNTNLILIPILLFFTPINIFVIDKIFNEKVKKKFIFKSKVINKNLTNCGQQFLKSLYKLTTLPDIAILEIITFFKTLYRIKISHQNLLQWTTASQVEQKNRKIEKLENKISKEDKNYLLSIALKTWQFYKQNMINYLPPDNYQEDRKNKLSFQTSPTNIGFLIMSTISSYDLGFEGKNDTLNLLENIVDTIEQLPKWNGHLYNWYNILTKEPVKPLDISSVDSGNFIGAMYCLKQFLIEEKAEKKLVKRVSKIISDTNFAKLFDEKVGLFSIGLNVESNKLYDSYYDLLATEARQTSLIAIAKRDVSAKHFRNLSRLFTEYKGNVGLVSWGGTTFEYMLPNINIPSYNCTLLNDACRFAMYSNIEYARKNSVPFGISESGFSVKDLHGNYQYKTFGVPWLGLKRGLEKSLVVSPYSTALFLQIDSIRAIENMHKLEKYSALGKYGFYESIDFSNNNEVVKSYMAHHQGMILSSIDNCLNNNIFQKRFMQNPEANTIKILLEERMQNNIILNKSKIPKTDKSNEYKFEKNLIRKQGTNLLANDNVSILTKENEIETIYYNEKLVYENANIFIKNVETNKVYDLRKILKDKTENMKVTLEFSSYGTKIKFEDGSISIILDAIIEPENNVVINQITIKNKQVENMNLELYVYQEPVLQKRKDFEMSKTYNRMFLNYCFEDNILGVTRKPKTLKEKSLSLEQALYPLENKLEYEIHKENFYNRTDLKNPEAVTKSKELSSKIDVSINPIICMKQKFSIGQNKEKTFYLLSAIDEDKNIAIEKIKSNMNIEKLKRVFEIAKTNEYEKNRFLQLNEKEIYDFQKMFYYLIQKIRVDDDKILLLDNDLWKYGISGDFPIASFEINQDTDRKDVIKMLKFYKYLRSKNFAFDLILFSNYNLDDEIKMVDLEQYLNAKPGIHILKNIPENDKEIILLQSNLTKERMKNEY